MITMINVFYVLERIGKPKAKTLDGNQSMR